LIRLFPISINNFNAGSVVLPPPGAASLFVAYLPKTGRFPGSKAA